MNKAYPATFFRYIWIAVLIASPLAEVFAKDSPNLQLNGVSSYTSLGTQQFIAALYLETPSTNAEQVLQADTAIMLEMRISVDRLSQRRFNRHWIESVTINSDSQQMKKQINNFSRFSKFFKGQLLRGDSVELEYNPQRGDVAVKLNSFTLGHIRSKAFFKLLLRSWIGDIPLSSEFRQELLSPNTQNPQLLAYFNSLIPSTARLRETRGWNRPSPKKLAVNKHAPARKTQPLPSQPLVNSLQTVKPNAKTVATANSRVESKRITSAPKGNNTLRKTKNSLTKPKNSQTRPKSSTQTKETTPPPTQATLSSASTAVKIPPQTATGNGEQPSSAGSTSDFYEAALLARQQYYKQLSSQVYKFQTLPRQAFQHRLEGDARVSITINRRGEVTNVRLEKESKHDIFNHQALDAVINASPFPPVPESIGGETYTFSVPINYKLPY